MPRIDVATGQKWEAKTKALAGRVIVITEIDPKTSRIRVYEADARSEDRWMTEASLRGNWRLQGAEPTAPKAKPQPAVEPTPVLVDAGREEELALLRRIADGIDKLVAAWGK